MLKVKKMILPAAVFITGGCVLILEVTATRVLSPYFGNTIYTVSSILGVILLALSLGYYFGGKLADSQPKLSWFYGLIFLSGLSVIILELFIILFLPALGGWLSIVYGPLIVAALLFFLPALLLGMLSPYAIKLYSLIWPEDGVGSVSGLIFFWSTLGSIAGSLLAGFVLIPNFGVDKIIIGTGIALCLIGFLPFFKKGFKLNYLLLAALVMLAVISELAIINLVEKNYLYARDGIYEKLFIFDHDYLGQPTRFFRQDRSNSGAMFLATDELVFDYTKYYELYKIFKPDLKQALVIGGGAYSIPKALLKEPGVENVEVAEIEPWLFELAKKYFRLPADQRLKNQVIDGRRYLKQTEKSYDLIFSDVYYSLYSLPIHFTTEEFFRLAKSRLSPDGVFMANLIGRLDDRPPSLIMSEIKTFKEVFPNSYFFAVELPQTDQTQNIIFVGWNSEKAADLAGRPEKEKLIDLSQIDFNLYHKLTDNYAPVEYLTAKVLVN